MATAATQSEQTDLSTQPLRRNSEKNGGDDGTRPAASAVTGQQRDVTDCDQTVSADIVCYKMEPHGTSYRPLNVPRFQLPNSWPADSVSGGFAPYLHIGGASFNESQCAGRPRRYCALLRIPVCSAKRAVPRLAGFGNVRRCGFLASMSDMGIYRQLEPQRRAKPLRAAKEILAHRLISLRRFW